MPHCRYSDTSTWVFFSEREVQILPHVRIGRFQELLLPLTSEAQKGLELKTPQGEAEKSLEGKERLGRGRRGGQDPLRDLSPLTSFCPPGSFQALRPQRGSFF